jgi:SAM-dependent methyltransferase
LLGLIFREMFTFRPLPRTVPPDLFSQEQGARVFHRVTQATLEPVDRLNAEAVSLLTPRRGTVLDLGCGTGRFLIHLSKCRPDLRLIGVERSQPMIALGRAAVHTEGLTERIDIRWGDMGRWGDVVTERPDTLVSMFALHDVPNPGDLSAALRALAWGQEVFGSALWVFDFARPRNASTLVDYSNVFLRGAPPVHHELTRHSLAGAWSRGELKEAASTAGLLVREHLVSRLMRLFQAMWHGSRKGRPLRRVAHPLTGPKGENLKALHALFGQWRIEADESGDWATGG